MVFELLPHQIWTTRLIDPAPQHTAQEQLQRIERSALQAGDLIYLPPVWAHGVLYLQDTAGMASLFRA